MMTKKLTALLTVFTVLLFLGACSGVSDLEIYNNDNSIPPSGFEVYGGFSNYHGVYKAVAGKTDWYAHENDSTKVIKKLYRVSWGGTTYEGYGWMFMNGNAWSFQNTGDTEYPPELNWECAYGVPKSFYVKTLYD